MASKNPKPAKRRCPTCRAVIQAATDNPTFPFCSDRCRAADLGKWLDGDYRIAAMELPDADEPLLN